MRVMRSRVIALTSVAIVMNVAARSAEPPRRKPLDPAERATLVALLGAVDAAQHRDAGDTSTVESPAPLAFEHHVLKSADQYGYVPFRVSLPASAEPLKAPMLYVRAVTRHEGFRAEERSSLREWLARGGDQPLPRQETVFVGPGELPVGGPASSSSRRSVQAPAEASALLTLQQRDYEKQKAAAEAAKQRRETREPDLFPLEEFYQVDVKSTRAVERALSLPAGDFDVYVAVLDRGHAKDGTPIVAKREVTIPDYWNAGLALSSLMLISSINTLKAPLPPEQQVQRPYTFGRAEVVPVKETTFSTRDVLSVAFQICNYGAPDSDLTADYNFYRIASGSRTLFNHTPPQTLTDVDLPPPSSWETQAFTSQSVPLTSFPAGEYELEVVVRDRLTRGVAKQMVRFTVQ